jgi:hypothetical protein
MAVLAAGEQHTTESRKAAPDHPAEPGDAGRADAVELGKITVVHHRPHPGAERGAEQQEPEPERDGHRHGHLADPVVGDGYAEHLDAPIPEQVGDVARLAGIEEPLRQAEQANRQRHRDDERGGVVGPLEPAQQPLDHDPHQRGQHQHHDGQRDRSRQPAADSQLEVHERRQHPDGAVGEVEHPRDRVREHEAHGRDGVDAAEHQPEQRELEQLRHVPLPRYAAWTAAVAFSLEPAYVITPWAMT